MKCRECYHESNEQEEFFREDLCQECHKGLEEFHKDIEMDARKNGDFDA